MHEVAHEPYASWCQHCVMGAGAAKPHHTLTFAKKDVGHATVLIDFAYMKTNGEFVEIGGEAPPPAELFATSLVIVDKDTGSLRGVAMPTKAVTDFSIASVTQFMARLNIGKCKLLSDNEPTMLALRRRSRSRGTRAATSRTSATGA